MNSQRGKTSNEEAMAAKKGSQPTEGSKTKSISVRWPEDLVSKLLDEVEGNSEIKQGLYPGTGADGGGKPKTEFYWRLAIHLFADNEEYSAPLAEAQRSSKKKDRAPWVLKVKNKLCSMADEVKRHDRALAEVGQGCTSQEEIDGDTPFAQSLDEVEKVCPWYVRMKRILDEHLNVELLGIGNSASELDLDVLTCSTEDDASSLGDTELVIASDSDDDDDDPWGEDERRRSNKRSASAAGLDEDTIMGLEDLTKIAVAEEVTYQKRLGLSIQKSKEKTIRAQIKAEIRKLEIEAKREKAKQAHEREMVKLQLEFARNCPDARVQGTNTTHPPIVQSVQRL